MNRSIGIRTAAGVTAALVGVALVGCGSDSDPAPAGDGGISGELRIFSYEDTVNEAKLNPFKAEHPDLTVRTAIFENNDEAAAKIKAGFATDLVEVCLDEQDPLVDAGMLAPIDTSRLDHWEDLDPTFRDAAGVTTNGEVTMIPLRAGAVGLIYDKEEFPDGVDSWSALFDENVSGRVSLDGGYWLTPFAIVALANGNQDPMNLDDDQVTEARDQLMEYRDHFRAFARSDADKANLFKSGEVVLADGGRQTAQDIIAGGGNVGWAAPKEGALSWVCGLSISSDAENIDAAYALLNNYMSPETQAIMGNDGFVMMNPNGVALVDPDFEESSDPGALEGAHPEVAPENADLWRKYWQEVRAG